MRIEELKQAGALYFENIRQGFDTCLWEYRSLKGEPALQFFQALREQAGERNAYLDFYYFALSAQEQERVCRELSKEEVKSLEEYRKKHPKTQWKTELIFPMTDFFLRLAVKLNQKEALFSTLYFCGDEKSTWWGNYGEAYVKFWEKR